MSTIGWTLIAIGVLIGVVSVYRWTRLELIDGILGKHSTAINNQNDSILVISDHIKHVEDTNRRAVADIMHCIRMLSTRVNELGEPIVISGRDVPLQVNNVDDQ